MTPRAWLNLTLLAVVAALALVAVYEPGIEAPPPATTLTDLDPDEVTRIRIQRADAEAVLLENRDGRWRLREPVTVAANEFRARSLARIAAAESLGTLPPADDQLSDFGLAPAKVRLWLNERELAFGGSTALDHRRYVLTGGVLHMIDDRYQHHLTAGWPEMVATALLEPEWTPVAIELPDLTLRRGEGGNWTVDPPQPEAGTDDVLGLVDAWRQADAVWVRRLEAGEAEAVISIHLDGEETPLKFEIRGREPDLVLGRRDLGIQYHLSAESADRLLRLREPETTAGGEVEQAVDTEAVPEPIAPPALAD